MPPRALPRVGVSACLFHEDRSRPVFNGKPLYYLESSMARWLASGGALVYMVPPAAPGALASAHAYAHDLDGLVLPGGVDVSPRTYGEEPLRPEWGGDPVRDAFEIELARAFHERGKPVLGVCRGHQVLNVAFGGTLYQDIVELVPGARVHRDADAYDRHAHAIDVEPGSELARTLGVSGRVKVNSVHHQAIKALAPGFVVDARSADDGVIEAAHLPGEAFLRGVQWHPEFTDPGDPSYLDNAPLLRAFLEAASESRSESRAEALRPSP
ncbi:MAG TPA: gamma-glutamyl-gamma-aminobutyrate hydrolase family protein [Polyangiaceae bacterium]|nr:gamma-glutamyl-gamma-aminobutyrate hydrolase family protein [Polyangiaceae bacterium]